MSNGMPSGQAVPAVERFPSEKGDSEFPRYPLPRGIDIYSRLLLPHSSTPVTQLATPTIARWWDDILVENVDIGMPKSTVDFAGISLYF